MNPTPTPPSPAAVAAALTTRQRAWLYVLIQAASEMQDARSLRKRTYGIAVETDNYALKFRRAQRRWERALLALTGWPFASSTMLTPRDDPEQISRWRACDLYELRKLKADADAARAALAAPAGERGEVPRG